MKVVYLGKFESFQIKITEHLEERIHKKSRHALPTEASRWDENSHVGHSEAK